MISQPRKSIDEVFADPARVQEALARGVEAALRRHKLLGQSIAVWRDGKVVTVPPEDIVVPPDAAAREPNPGRR